MKNTVKLIISIVACNTAGIIGALVTSPDTVWFKTLHKPTFQPPNWLFGPVWTILYTLMGITVYLLWRDGFKNRKRKQALGLFVFQFTLNNAWSFIFFDQQQIGWALVEISILWGVIVTCIIFFYKLQKVAAWLLLPYLLWVSFALFLNFTLWQLNP